MLCKEKEILKNSILESKNEIFYNFNFLPFIFDFQSFTRKGFLTLGASPPYIVNLSAHKSYILS